MRFLKHVLFSVSVLNTASAAWAQNSQLQSTRPAIFSKPVALDWRSIPWQTINYNRLAVDGGGAIYTLPSSEALKFKLSFVFPGGVYTQPRSDRTAYGAMIDLMVLGGFGNLNFEEIQNYTIEYGINLQTSLNAYGQVVVSADALARDFDRTLALLEALMLAPRFEAAALPLWKQQSLDGFQSLRDGNTVQKQMRFIEAEANKIAFGKDHYFASLIERISPKEVQAVEQNKIKDLFQKTINRNGLNVSLSGSFTPENIKKVEHLITQIPRLEPQTKTWLPNRNLQGTTPKIHAAVIQKSDMTQSNITLRYYFSTLGKLNPIEEMQVEILGEIFSSKGGVVGNDRFTKALRADSGLSYSPSASFSGTVVSPNTNVGAFYLNFQSPNEKIAEAVNLAKKTWEKFVTKGVSQEELDNTRTAMMNRILASEYTVFNKMDLVMDQILRGDAPTADPLASALLRLDAVRDAKALNATLFHLFQAKNAPVLIMMGNPPEEQLAQLKAFPDLDLIEKTEIDSMIHYNAEAR